MSQQVFNELGKYEQQGAHIFLPSAFDSNGNGFFIPQIETVFIDPGKKEAYSEGKNSFRISHIGLSKLANAAGIEWDPVHSCRTDNRADKMYVSYRAVGGVRKSDGRLYPEKGEYDLDLEVIEEEIRQGYVSKRNSDYQRNKSEEEFMQYVDFCTKRDFMQKRKHKLKLAESGAKDRVIRNLLSIRPSYTTDELKKPFVLVRFVLNHSHPDLKRAFINNANSGLGLYSNAPLQLPQPDATDIESGSTLPDTQDIEPGNDMTSLETDFVNLSIEEQAGVIEELSLRKSYDLGSYLNRAQKKLDELSPEKLFELYQHLNTFQDTQEA